MSSSSSSLGSLGFTKAQRLLKPADFQRVFDQVDCKQGGKYCTLLSRKNNGDACRLGLIVAKRNIKQAVGRNRVKRLVRESFRHSANSFDKLPHRFDVIVLVKAQAAMASSHDLRLELDRQWSKLINKRTDLDQDS